MIKISGAAADYKFAHQTLVDCGEKIVHGLSMDPKAMATSLHTKGFITDHMLKEINTLSQTKTDKARCLYSAILEFVKEYPQRYSDFIQILQKYKLLHGDLLKELQETYQKNSMLFRYCMHVGIQHW